MKKIALGIVFVYKNILSPIIHSIAGPGNGCRYSPTCSEYARIHITRDGVVKGSIKSFLRILYCHPFAKKLPVALQK
ncbi:MAG TPA: membrane protein insertion efficiency factor YidD [Candidatus Eisenbacteria bacterium]|nr:membrane protein insertion efficiency factor YidD [Candidatus Eisenbacteria bacterium]